MNKKYCSPYFRAHKVKVECMMIPMSGGPGPHHPPHPPGPGPHPPHPPGPPGPPGPFHPFSDNGEIMDE